MNTYTSSNYVKNVIFMQTTLFIEQMWYIEQPK